MSLSRLIAPFALGMAALVATPASAALTVNSSGTVTVTGSSGSTTLNINGFTDTGPIQGLTASLTLTLQSASNGLYTFGYTLVNTSTAPTTASRITAFGFDTNSPVAAGGATILDGEVFDSIRYNKNISNGLGTVDICFTTNNCSGGGSAGDGVNIGQSTSGRFSLQLVNMGTTTFNIGNIALRYQAIDSTNIRGGSGVGVVTPVPEPGTWALMLFGFGAAGFAMRRQRRGHLLQVA